jgi:putative ABC transport system substrate-binding protein
MMRRRDCIAGLSSAATLPFTAWALPTNSMIGVLSSLDEAVRTKYANDFAQGLKLLGFVEGHNVTFSYRFAEGRFERLPSLAADMVHQQPAIIVAIAPPAALAAKAATSTIPIVFSVGTDPIQIGLVGSINRPEANLTGIYILVDDLGAKSLGLLRELLPQAALIGVLANPHSPAVEHQLHQLQTAAKSVGQQILVVYAGSKGELEVAFDTLADRKIDALDVLGDPFFTQERKRIVALAYRHRIPAAYDLRDFAEVGGLMSYGTSLKEVYHQLGVYVGKLLRGVKPADLPIQQSNKIEFVINLKAAKTLGLEIHPQLIARADEVIE